MKTFNRAMGLFTLLLLLSFVFSGCSEINVSPEVSNDFLQILEQVSPEEITLKIYYVCPVQADFKTAFYVYGSS